jgi:hypothetical protein
VASAILPESHAAFGVVYGRVLALARVSQGVSPVLLSSETPQVDSNGEVMWYYAGPDVVTTAVLAVPTPLPHAVGVEVVEQAGLGLVFCAFSWKGLVSADARRGQAAVVQEALATLLRTAWPVRPCCITLPPGQDWWRPSFPLDVNLKQILNTVWLSGCQRELDVVLQRIKDFFAADAPHGTLRGGRWFPVLVYGDDGAGGLGVAGHFGMHAFRIQGLSCRTDENLEAALSALPPRAFVTVYHDGQGHSLGLLKRLTALKLPVESAIVLWMTLARRDDFWVLQSPLQSPPRLSLHHAEYFGVEWRSAVTARWPEADESIQRQVFALRNLWPRMLQICDLSGLKQFLSQHQTASKDDQEGGFLDPVYLRPEFWRRIGYHAVATIVRDHALPFTHSNVVPLRLGAPSPCLLAGTQNWFPKPVRVMASAAPYLELLFLTASVNSVIYSSSVLKASRVVQTLEEWYFLKLVDADMLEGLLAGWTEAGQPEVSHTELAIVASSFVGHVHRVHGAMQHLAQQYDPGSSKVTASSAATPEPTPMDHASFGPRKDLSIHQALRRAFGSSATNVLVQIPEVAVVAQQPFAVGAPFLPEFVASQLFPVQVASLAQAPTKTIKYQLSLEWNKPETWAWLHATLTRCFPGTDVDECVQAACEPLGTTLVSSAQLLDILCRVKSPAEFLEALKQERDTYLQIPLLSFFSDRFGVWIPSDMIPSRTEIVTDVYQ